VLLPADAQVGETALGEPPIELGDDPEAELGDVAALGEFPNAELGKMAELGEFPNDLQSALGEFPNAELDDVAALGEFPNAELGELGDLDGLLATETEAVEDDQEVKVNPQWRVERRNDRNPPGFAIYQRGKPVYIGYVGYNSKGPKPDGFPTYNQLAGRS
jgi:hypothetical protein